MGRTVYHKRPFGVNKKFKLSRTGLERWHYTRTMVTHLFTYDRIETTHAKAYHLKPTADKVIAYARKFQETENEQYLRLVQSKIDNNSF